jgi:dGTPase
LDTFGEAEEILQPLANNKARMPANMSEREKVAKWRAVAIGELVRDVADVFTEKQQSILDGTFSEELINLTLKRDLIKKAKSVAKQKIYWSERKTKIEVAGHEIISGLLRIFVTLVTEIREREWNDQNFSGYRQKCARLILPDGFRGVTGSYEALLRITDFISGMTDRFALELYRKLKGISV